MEIPLTYFPPNSAHACPGLNPQPWCVPWPGIEPKPFQCMDDALTKWATLAKAMVTFIGNVRTVRIVSRLVVAGEQVLGGNGE